MPKSDFPMFGICPVCSADGGDKAQADLDPADAGYAVTSDGSNTDVRTVANGYLVDETGGGVPLVMYQGRKMCEICKNRLISDEESLVSARRHAEEEIRRAGMGFVKTI